jgi:DNA excision repair protein ERCC-4
MKIVVDTREQLPYSFETPSEVGTVPVGDYTIAGLENRVAIERKSLDDLIGCLTTGRERFERELHKSRALDYFAVVVEASLSDIANGEYRSNVGPKSAIQSLLAFSVRYRLPIFFCESREYGQRVTESLLLKYGREIEKQFKAISKGNQQHDAKPHTKFRMAPECQHPQR